MAKPKRGKRSARQAQATPPATSPSSDRVAAFTPTFIDDLRWWVSTNPRIAERILQLVQAVQRDPFQGIGKPEPLRHIGANTWSRRITEEHRLVYQVSDRQIVFLQARYHY